jgi:CheY-like chemotaxis protein
MTQPVEGRSPRILIVDDQRSNVRLLEQTLRRAGYEQVTSTTEPCLVTGMHQEHQYDLILLDLQMPTMTGLQVIAQLQEIRAERPVSILVLSADGTQTKAAITGGADSFLAKPFKLPDVVERVQTMLQVRG